MVCCPFKITTSHGSYVTFRPANINVIHCLSRWPTILSSARMWPLPLYLATVTKSVWTCELRVTARQQVAARVPLTFRPLDWNLSASGQQKRLLNYPPVYKRSDHSLFTFGRTCLPSFLLSLLSLKLLCFLSFVS